MAEAPLRFALDEHLRGYLFHAIIRESEASGFPIDIVQVGDPPDLPLGAKDPQIVRCAELHRRILISRDRKSLPSVLAAHLKAGRHSPGIITLPHKLSVPDVIDLLVVAAYASDSDEWKDQIRPLQ